MNYPLLYLLGAIIWLVVELLTAYFSIKRGETKKKVLSSAFYIVLTFIVCILWPLALMRGISNFLFMLIALGLSKVFKVP
jgi:uncharacterized membrane protein YozB (DUF420 family)